MDDTSPTAGQLRRPTVEDPVVTAWCESQKHRAWLAARDLDEDDGPEYQALNDLITETEEPLYHPAASIAGIAAQFERLMQVIDDFDIDSGHGLCRAIRDGLQRLSGFEPREGRVPGLDDLLQRYASRRLLCGHPDRQLIVLAASWRGLKVRLDACQGRPGPDIDGIDYHEFTGCMAAIEEEIFEVQARTAAGLAVKLWIIGYVQGCNCDAEIFEPGTPSPLDGTERYIVGAFRNCLALADMIAPAHPIAATASAADDSNGGR